MNRRYTISTLVTTGTSEGESQGTTHIKTRRCNYGRFTCRLENRLEGG